MKQEWIDIAAVSAQEAAKFSLEGLRDSRARAHALLLVLLAGGGGLGGLALTYMGSKPVLCAAAMGASVWWFLGAAWVAWRALTSDSILSWSLGNLLSRAELWVQYRHDLVSEGNQDDADQVDVELQLKLESVQQAQDARDSYRTASSKAYTALDQAYRAMAMTPLISAVMALLYLVG